MFSTRLKFSAPVPFPFLCLSILESLLNRRFVVAAMCGLVFLAAAASVPAQWTRGSSMLSTRTEVAVAAVGDLVYVAGGFGGAQNLEIYDPRTDRWSLGASVPQRVHHAAAVALNGKLYLIGNSGTRGNSGTDHGFLSCSVA